MATNLNPSRTQKPQLQPACKRRRVQGEELPEPTPKSSRPGENRKPQPNIKDGDLPSNCKSPKHDNIWESKPAIDRSKDNFVKAWLSLTDDGDSFEEFDIMTPSPVDNGESAEPTSVMEKTSDSTAYNPKYREWLGYRNIFIQKADPPAGLIRRAKEITTKSRSSPGLDNAITKQLKKMSIAFQDEPESTLVRKVVPHLIPAPTRMEDKQLDSRENQMWSSSVPVPLDPSITRNPLPLPRPKPDYTFGYSSMAFTKAQLDTISYLTDRSGGSYAVPYEIYFPFFCSEFKSTAKRGTHYTATDQNANSGAIASNGFVELTRRSLGLDSLDYDEPQFFSLSMDYVYVQINSHWLSISTEDGEYDFHMEVLSRHFLDDEDGLRATRQAVENILDWGRNERLPKIHKLLEAYRNELQRGAKTKKAAAVPKNASTRSKPPKGQKRRKPADALIASDTEDEEP